MILGEASRTAASAATLDDLFRRAGVSHPDTLALADPPNRADFTDGAPRRLSYAQADRAISAFAAKLRGLGLHTDSVVAMQLPNTVESIVAFLGVLRAGHDRGANSVALASAGYCCRPRPHRRQGDHNLVAHRVGCSCGDRDAGRGRAVSRPPGLRIRPRSAGRNGAARRRVRIRPG